MYKQSLFAISALALISTNVFANTDTKKLDEVVVTAKSDKKIEDLSSSVTVITAEDIAKLNATNIKDILVKQAGIITSGATSMTGGRESFSIRGLDHTYSLILVDGKKINPTEGYIGHSDFNTLGFL
ncbi:TonB-dependent receptor plug domain-containing protein [Arcobacter vandammei]|uniref:TonB-dependent receptor plug domain-containing protein n=1 Tax=Arcobacter vandammei TaxID=2782243 RepID=UPI0018DF2056|nr:TonB-dependent receptor plug domain-containing protein [Arcobacter vandammei]